MIPQAPSGVAKFAKPDEEEAIEKASATSSMYEMDDSTSTDEKSSDAESQTEDLPASQEEKDLPELDLKMADSLRKLLLSPLEPEDFY